MRKTFSSLVFLTLRDEVLSGIREISLVQLCKSHLKDALKIFCFSNV